SVTAAYNGTSSFLASTSLVVTQTVNAGSTSTSLSSTPNPSVTGQTVVLTATVTAVSPATGTPSGTVTFMDGTTSLGVATLVNGRPSLSSALRGGPHSLTVAYNGTASFLSSTSLAVTQTVNAGSSNTSVSSTPNPSVNGQTVTLKATVSSAPPATGVPTGTVTFRDGLTSLGDVTLVDGVASLTVALQAGAHSVTAAYNGSAGFLASASSAVTQTVNPGSTGTALPTTPVPSVTGQTVTLSATVSPVAPATGVPTGTVTFSDGTTSLGVVTLVNGSAALSISTLAPG